MTSFLVVDLGFLAIGAYVLHRIIRSAISEGMKDYTLWKIQLDAELDAQELDAELDAQELVAATGAE